MHSNRRVGSGLNLTEIGRFSVSKMLFLIGLGIQLISLSQQVEVRLIGGRTPFEGIVEVRRDGKNSWRYMCGTDAGWDLTVARAVCKQLGYFTVMWEWSNSEFGKSDLQSSVCDVRCPIMSESLEDCTIDWDNNGHDCQCHDNYHVGITCYYPDFLGRYKESYDRIFPVSTALQILQSDITIQKCIGACRDSGKVLAVLESGDECYCGNDFANYRRYGEAIPGLPILHDTNAAQYNTRQCSGDHGTLLYMQGCGGDWQFDVYNTSFGACGVDYTDSSGYIYSPNFPGNYTNEQSCTWTITVDPGHIVKLTTLMLRLQDNDIVIVKDGIEDNSSILAAFIGHSLPQPVYSSSYTLRIEMITSNTGNDLGFIMQYEGSMKAETTISSSTQQSTQMTSDTTKKTTVSKGPSQQPPATVSSTVDTSTVQLHTVILISIEQSTRIKNTSRQMTVTSTPTKSATSQETEDRIITKSRSTDVSKHFTSASASSEGIGSNEDMYMYIGIGGGMFIFLALVLIVVIVVLLRRKQRTKTQESEENMLTPIPDLVRKSDSPESVYPDVTPAARESDAHTAFINESYRPESVAPNRESIGIDDSHRIDETLTGGLTADYELLGPVSANEPVHLQSIDKTPSQFDDAYAPVDMHKKRSNINSTYEWKSEMESQHGLTDRQNTNEDMQTTEDTPVDDRESEEVPAVPERSQLRLEDSDDVGQMYAQVDKSKKKGRSNETGYVDNVLYESMSDKEPSQREGFVDNIIYETASNRV